MSKLKLGILGGGLNSVTGYTHFVASQMDGKFKVVSGVFSRHKDINEKTAKYWSVKRYYDNLEDFIKNEKGKLNAVSVLLPTPYHYEVVKKLLENGFYVICEKPLFSTYEEIINFEKFYNPKKHYLVVTYNYIAYPMLGYLKKIIKEGYLGNILHVHLEMPQESFLRPPKHINYPPAWRKKDGKIPGILLDLASHLGSIFFYLTGNFITEVKEVLGAKYSKFNVYDDIKVLAKSDDINIFLWVSKVSLGNRNGLKISIFGDKASAIWIQEKPEFLYINKDNGEKIKIDRSYEDGYFKNRIFNRMTPGHPSGFIEAFANLYSTIYEDIIYFKKHKKHINNDLIWTFEKEKKNLKILDKISSKL